MKFDRSFKNRVFPTVFLGIFAFASWFAFADTKVTSIDFKAGDSNSEITIQSDSPLSYQKSENQQDHQVILDLTGASLAKSASRGLDTSSFNSSVNLISPYAVDKNARVVIQLRDMQTVGVNQDGNVLKITVPNGSSSTPVNGSASTTAATPTAATSAPTAAAGAPQVPTPIPTDKTYQQDDSDVQINVRNPAARLQQFMSNASQKRFSGKPITLQLRDADVADVFRLIGDASGFNIVVGDDVKGKVTISLIDVPWDQALDVILHTQHLGAERNNNLLRIVTLANLTQEKQQELAAKQAEEASAPRVTRIFPISYANITDLVTTLGKFASQSAAAGAAASASLNIVQPDSRTNSIIVRDTPENVERMKKLLEILDTQTPQVQIEAKVIETTEGYQKNLNGALAINGYGGAIGFNGGDPGNDLVSSAGSGVLGPSFPVATQALNAGYTPGISILNALGLNRINALLSIGELETNVRVISSPKSVVLNREATTILSSTPVLTPTTTISNGITTTTQIIQQANLSLQVTPTVTNEGSVLLQLTVSRDVPFDLGGGNSAVSNRNMTTKVLVATGSTLVMGGIYTNSTNKSSFGVPFLRKLPLIGALFGGEGEIDSKTELMFFITPKILNPKEAGLGST